MHIHGVILFRFWMPEWRKCSLPFFCPLGKLADRAIYFTFRHFFFFYSEQSYLSIYCTDFHDLFTKWKVFAWIFSIQSSFSDSKPCAIFAIFTPHESILGVDDRSDIFSISQGTMPWQPILWQSYLPPCTYHSGIQKRNGITPCISMIK